MEDLMNKNINTQRETSSAIWLWFKSSLSITDIEDDWKHIMASGEAIVKQYDNKLAEDLYFAYLDELERLVKGNICKS